MAMYVRFERGRDDVCGPVLGPYEWVQQTYEDLRVSPDGEIIAQWVVKAGEWFIVSGEHEDEFYSDFIVSNDGSDDGSHDCNAGKLTHTDDGTGKLLEEKWANGDWVQTGRVWDAKEGRWA